jgi:hypothetical protein
LGRPHADLITTSQYPNMKELRTQHRGRPYRTLFAFDPRRVAILLIGGDKTGNDRCTRSSCRVPTRSMPGICRQLRKSEQSQGGMRWQETFVIWKPGCRPNRERVRTPKARR